MTLVKVHCRQIEEVVSQKKSYELPTVVCINIFRKVHHGGLGKEGNSVPWFGGETGSTEEDSGWIKGAIFRKVNVSRIA